MNESSHYYLKAVSGNARWPIVCTLYDNPKGLTVKGLMEKLMPGLSVSRVCHQLRILRDNNVVVSERVGKTAVYRISDRQRVGKVLNI